MQPFTENGSSAGEGNELELLRWQKEMHKGERDIYLATSCLLAQALVLAICYHRDRYERYVEYKLG